MLPTEYHQRIVDYYAATENAYKDSWDLNNSLAIHYGYRDKGVRTFADSLQRMNAVMAESAGIREGETVLDAGCGVGGSSIFLAQHYGATVKGITLSPRQVQHAEINAEKKEVTGQVKFQLMDYCATDFPDHSFDVVWGCESICYAANKEQFIKEAYRLLRPGGRLVVADGLVTKYEHNRNPVIRQWLDGWQVNYLETADRFQGYMQQTGFSDIQFRDISREVAHSSRRLLRFYYLANLYLYWKTITLSNRATAMQKLNIRACKFQYIGMKRNLWQYGLVTGWKL